MYAITKLSENSRIFVTELLQTNKSRSLATSIALARVLGSKVSIPAEPVTDVAQYYRLQAQALVEKCAFFINEMVVIDTKTVIDYSMKYFMFRYHCAHPTRRVALIGEKHPVADFFEVNRAFGNEALDVICECRRELTHTVNKFEVLYDELWPKDAVEDGGV